MEWLHTQLCYTHTHECEQDLNRDDEATLFDPTRHPGDHPRICGGFSGLHYRKGSNLSVYFGHRRAASEPSTFAWVSNFQGRRNIWLANAQAEAHPITHYTSDDGIEVSDIAFVPHHDQLLYSLGGDIEYPDKPAPNPAQISTGVTQQVYLVGFHGDAPIKIADGHSPVASPDGERILFIHEGKIYSIANKEATSGKSGREGDPDSPKPDELFKTRGSINSLSLSPDGKHLAFVSGRGDHSIGPAIPGRSA